MKITISGASGFIGTYLKEMFNSKGYETIPLTREDFKPGSEEILNKKIEGSEVVINLAGASLNHRWTTKYKKEIRDSRILFTRKIVSAIHSAQKKPSLLISTSAVGYYPSEGCFNEYNFRAGKGFLSQICLEWEKEAQKVNPEVRLVITRFGVVLSPEGGAFKKMYLPHKFGVAAVMGNGKQSVSWIDLQDLGRAIHFIINHQGITGIVNMVAPDRIDNLRFTNSLAKHFTHLVTFRIPSSVLKLIMGKTAELITDGQCAIPDKLLRSGFDFQSDTIDKFIENRIKNK